MKNEISNPVQIPLSSHQRAAYEAVMNGESVALDSCAGSGKTHTACAITFNINKSVEHVPFGRSLADAMIEKFSSSSHVTVLNFHRRGLKMIGNVTVDFDKVKDLCADLEDGLAVAGLVKMLKTEAFGLETVNYLTAEQIAEKYGINIDHCDEAVKVLAKSDELTNIVDFEDMLRLPVVLGKVAVTDSLFVFDEVQDYTPLSWAFVKECLTTAKSHVFMVGDPSRQCLMAFAGADQSLFDTMARHYGCQRLELIENRRCAKAVIENAPYKGNMMPLGDAPEGSVTSMAENDVVASICDGLYENDAVLSEVNAPLINLGINLLVKGVSVRMRTAKLEKLIMRYAYKYLDTRKTPVGEIANKLDVDIAERAGDGGDISEAVDVCKCIRALETYCLSKAMVKPKWVRRGRRSIPQNPIQTALIELLGGDSGITLMTGHTAKGLEWNTVFHLPATTKAPEQEWQVNQNECLAHVICTRAITNHVTLIAND